MEVIPEDKEQLSFQYANECDLEIHCSPFGLSGLYIKIKGTNIIGIGSTMGLITGSTTGLVHYNDSQDLMDQKYKLYVVVDEEGTLRIDFTKINPLKQSTEESSDKPEDGNKSKSDEFIGRSPNSISTNENSSSYTSSLKSPQNANTDRSDQTPSEEETPSLIFRGKCPDGRPDNTEPFIGILSFERGD